MKQRLSLVTLGVRDKQRARRFYEALGWRGVGGSGDEPVFFQTGEMIVTLWERASLAADSCVEDSGGWGGVTFAHCVASAREVDAITDAARAAGTDAARAAGTEVGREPAETFWGGYSWRWASWCRGPGPWRRHAWIPCSGRRRGAPP